MIISLTTQNPSRKEEKFTVDSIIQQLLTIQKKLERNAINP